MFSIQATDKPYDAVPAVVAVAFAENAVKSFLVIYHAREGIVGCIIPDTFDGLKLRFSVADGSFCFPAATLRWY
jgi:hypothetical protein